jgi:hypothetical protein
MRSVDVRVLIRQMHAANPLWGARARSKTAPGAKRHSVHSSSFGLSHRRGTKDE